MKKKYDLSGVTCYYSNNISGICRLIEVSNENDQPSNDSQLKRFVRPNDNFDSFKLNEKFEKFEYPPSTKRELKNWYTSKNTNCMERLLSCIYDFLVTQYKMMCNHLKFKI
ncbi:hypothetical protein RhiirA1_468194 [Rhizophagus irregularis]|uniref:Uncharacterized protein n=1 Tax=Rhizophagus irregularis TaxID=588596 RepID=A0A2I1E1T7_9GLOM|nr:hypothetical protein RhiirA1_468194 [Rhizophagus irregularis]PKY16097.1 hypothetical protein RhiirB3_428421 [Rhizophagus irregularis]